MGDPDPDALRCAPEVTLRQVFDAFRLSVTYDGRTGDALCRAVVSDDTLPAIQDALAGIQRGGRWHRAGSGWKWPGVGRL